METPKRVQRKRTKGFKLPENTVCVTRGTKWGNPFKVGEEQTNFKGQISKVTPKQAVAHYENYIMLLSDKIAAIKSELKGKNLACFCSLDSHCHADLLLKIANE